MHLTNWEAVEIQAAEKPGYLEAIFENCQYVTIGVPKGSYSTSNVDVAILFPADDLELAWSREATSYSATISAISKQREINVDCEGKQIYIYVR